MSRLTTPCEGACTAVVLVLTSTLTACGGWSPLPTGAPSDGPSQSRDASLEDASVDGATTDASPVDASVDDASTPRLPVHRSVKASVEVGIMDMPGLKIRQLQTFDQRAISFQTLPENLEIRRAVWEFDVDALRPPDGYELLEARVLVKGDASLAPVDFQTYPADVVGTLADYDVPGTLFGQITGTSGDDGLTWSFDLTSPVSAALTADEGIGVRAQLTQELFNGHGTLSGMGFAALTIELDYVPKPGAF